MSPHIESQLKFMDHASNAVIMEALRIHPSTGLMFERYVPAGGLVLHDKFIPAGTTIGVNAWVFNRDKNIFGDDSDAFRPERWIEGKPECLKEMRRYMFTVSRAPIWSISSLDAAETVVSYLNSSALGLARVLAST